MLIFKKNAVIDEAQIGDHTMTDGIKKHIDVKEISYTRGKKKKKRKTSTLDDRFRYLINCSLATNGLCSFVVYLSLAWFLIGWLMQGVEVCNLRIQQKRLV